MLPDIPGSGHKRGEQSTRENSSRLKRVNAEDVAGMSGVVTPLIDYVQNFRADNPAENNQNAEIPGLIAVVAKALGVARAHPQTEKHTQGDEEPIGRQKETPGMNELREHCLG